MSCIAEKGLLNRAHAYKAAVDQNNASGKKEMDEGISLGLFSYPLLMASDILAPNATHVPVGKDQQQHLEITRDIAEKFNNKYGDFFNVPEAVIQDEKTVLGTDGKKMSKSYNNIIPLLSTEQELRKSVMRIVTNSQKPGEKKDWKDNILFSIYSSFTTEEKHEEMKFLFEDGIGWGDAKQKVFDELNLLLTPIREKFAEQSNNKKYIEEILKSGAEKVRAQTIPTLKEVKRLVGISKL